MKSTFQLPVKLLMKVKDLNHAELKTALHLYAWGTMIESRHVVFTTSGLANYTGAGKTTQIMEKLHKQRIIKVRRTYKHYKHIGETTWYIQLSMLPLKAYQKQQ